MLFAKERRNDMSAEAKVNVRLHSWFVTSLAMFYALHALGVLRVSTAGELQGLDLHEHGIPAYPEYALHASAAPQGTPEFTAAAFGSEPRVAMGHKMAKS